MFVTNHVLSGAVVGQLLKRKPFTAFVVGVGSHLLLDSIPHWGCDWDEPGGMDRFFRAAVWDGLLGATVMMIATVSVDRMSRRSTVAAMAGAVLLDLDKPISFATGWNPFPGIVQQIHSGIQNESEEGMTNEVRFGLAFAAVDAVTAFSQRRRRTAHRPTTAASPHRPARHLDGSAGPGPGVARLHH
jgi:hypothetical protein